MADDAHRLLSLQTAYEKELEHKFQFAGLSVNDFILALLSQGFQKRAERVRVDWKVPDKRWWWLKIRALAGNKDWEALEAFAKSKKSPIGYEPFVVSLLVCSRMSCRLLMPCRRICLGCRRHSRSRRHPLLRDAIQRSVPTCTSGVANGVEQQKRPRSAMTAPSLSESFLQEMPYRLTWYSQLKRSAPNGIAQREVEEVIRRMTK